MAIDLTQFEHGDPFPGDADGALAELQQRLAQLQIAQVVHARRALIIFEGWPGAGKKGALKRLVGALDPCHVTTHSVRRGDAGADGRHWLAPFWSALPPAGDTTIFFRSWYRRLIEDRIAGVEGKRWSRMCDEINEFESQQHDHGTLVIKLFFHVTAHEQQERLNERRNDPWRRHLAESVAPPSKEERAATLAALHEMFVATDTRWAPWRVIDANDKQAARIAALTTIADVFQKALPVAPPATDETVIAFPSQKSA